MIYELNFSKTFKIDFGKHKKSGQKILLKKIELFLAECFSDPRNGTGNPERLKYIEVGKEIWSREINKKHRLVYEIEDQNVHILSAWGQYDDK